MELRVWVDGVQRIVCGVRLTTTCQEIVFVLAKATHQAGRFTMIERWRDNERLLSPNEQPLVTLQRWGEHMNEVEFILKKASSDISLMQQQQQPNNQPQMPTQQLSRAPQLPNQQLITTNSNNIHDNSNQAQQQQQHLVGGTANGNGNGISNNMRASPMSPMQSARNSQFIDSTPSYPHNQYNLNRRPQTSLGPLTSSSSALGIGALNYPQHIQKTSALHPMVMRNSLSTSTLPDLPKPNNNILSTNARYIEEQLLNSSPSSPYGPLHNGYQNRSETSNTQHYFNNHQQADQQVQQQQQATKNNPFEELYSTINKKRVHNPPAVPAKPRLAVPITSLASLPSYPLHQTMNSNAQANFFNGSRTGSPSTIFHNNLRPRHPPGYSDYLEALASRNSSSNPVNPSSAYISHPQSLPQQSNTSTVLKTHQANNSGISQSSYSDNRYQDHNPCDPTAANYRGLIQDDQPDRVARNPVRSRLSDSGFVVNLGSAVNVRLPPSSYSSSQIASHDDQHRSLNPKSVSEIGHDMLKMIEEQKKVLLNQKDELDRLDNDRDYWETKQTSEQVELINRIENEIHQLEELWRENQAQITKLEYQDLDREVKDLKAEQSKIESEIEQQKNKLVRCEEKITTCKSQINRLESELATFTSDSSPVNGTSSSGDKNCVKNNSNSDGEDGIDDDSEGDYSDDLNLAASDLKSRVAKELGYVDKRGLISGLRSLKLDKARGTKQPKDNTRPSSFSDAPCPSSSPETKANNKNSSTSSNNNNVNNGCSETNGQYSSTKTATSNNQYEFLMTL